MGNDVSLVAVRLELAPNTGISIVNERGFGAVSRLKRVGSVGIDPELDFCEASTVIELERDVGRLLRNVANLTDKRNLDCLSYRLGIGGGSHYL